MKQEFKEAIELHNQGYDPEEIAEELNISRATAYRWINQHETSLSLAGVEDDEGYQEDEEELSGMGAIEENNKLKRKELALLERKEAVLKEKSKRVLHKQLRTLASGILEHASGSKWSHDEVSETLSQIESLKEGISEYFEFDEDELEVNSAYQILSILEEEFETLADSGSGYTYVFDWSQSKIDLLVMAMEIDDLEDESFDIDDFHKETAQELVESTMNGIESYDNKSVDSDAITKMEGLIKTSLKGIELPELREHFQNDIEKLKKIKGYLKELSIRVDESFWGEKTFKLPSDLVELENE